MKNKKNEKDKENKKKKKGPVCKRVAMVKISFIFTWESLDMSYGFPSD